MALCVPPLFILLRCHCTRTFNKKLGGGGERGNLRFPPPPSWNPDASVMNYKRVLTCLIFWMNIFGVSYSKLAGYLSLSSCYLLNEWSKQGSQSHWNMKLIYIHSYFLIRSKNWYLVTKRCSPSSCLLCSHNAPICKEWSCSWLCLLVFLKWPQ